MILDMLELIMSYVGDEKIYYEIIQSEIIPKHLKSNVQNSKFRFLINKTTKILVCRDIISQEIDQRGNILLKNSQGICIPDKIFAKNLFITFLQTNSYNEAFWVFDLIFDVLTYEEQIEFAKDVEKPFLSLRNFVLNIMSITLHRSKSGDISIILYSEKDMVRFFLYCELYSYYYSCNFSDFMREMGKKNIHIVREISDTCLIVYKTNIDMTYMNIINVERSYNYKDVTSLFLELKKNSKMFLRLCKMSTIYEIKRQNRNK